MPGIIPIDRSFLVIRKDLISLFHVVKYGRLYFKTCLVEMKRESTCKQESMTSKTDQYENMSGKVIYEE